MRTIHDMTYDKKCREIIGNNPNMKKDTIKQGERSEMIFAHKCMIEYGYSISIPFTTEDYDVIVDTKEKLIRVQIKSSIKGDGNVMICKGTNAVKSGKQGKYPYPEGGLDFFAVHDIVNDTWYMIPRSVTGDVKNLRIALKRAGKYTPYKDNWDFDEHYPIVGK
jgi:hypothetical protein